MSQYFLIPCGTSSIHKSFRWAQKRVGSFFKKGSVMDWTHGRHFDMPWQETHRCINNCCDRRRSCHYVCWLNPRCYWDTQWNRAFDTLVSTCVFPAVMNQNVCCAISSHKPLATGHRGRNGPLIWETFVVVAEVSQSITHLESKAATCLPEAVSRVTMENQRLFDVIRWSDCF